MIPSEFLLDPRRPADAHGNAVEVRRRPDSTSSRASSSTSFGVA